METRHRGNPGHMYKRTVVSLLAIASLAVAGCSSDTQDSVTSDVESAITEVSSAVDDAVTEVSQAVESGTQDAAEAAVRNIATQQGEEQFTNAGHALDGPLECETVTTDGVDSIEVSCTGTTEEGGAAELTGTTNEIPGASVSELEGEFTGTVDGEEVFSTQTLGG